MGTAMPQRSTPKNQVQVDMDKMSGAYDGGYVDLNADCINDSPATGAESSNNEIKSITHTVSAMNSFYDCSKDIQSILLGCEVTLDSENIIFAAYCSEAIVATNKQVLQQL